MDNDSEADTAQKDDDSVHQNDAAKTQIPSTEDTPDTAEGCSEDSEADAAIAMSDVLITDITARLVHYGDDDDYELCTLYDAEWSKYAVEAGHRETASKDADTSECNEHQFTAKDDACDPMGSDDIEADPIPSTKDCFRTHDQPPPKTFQWKRTKHPQKQNDNDTNADITSSVPRMKLVNPMAVTTLRLRQSRMVLADSKVCPQNWSLMTTMQTSQSVRPNKFVATSMMTLKMPTTPITLCTSSIPRMRLVNPMAVTTLRLRHSRMVLADPNVCSQSRDHKV